MIHGSLRGFSYGQGKFGAAVAEEPVDELEGLVDESPISEHLAPRSSKPSSQRTFDQMLITQHAFENSLYAVVKKLFNWLQASYTGCTELFKRYQYKANSCYGRLRFVEMSDMIAR